MRYKWTGLLVAAMLLGVLLPSVVAAEAQLDSVLGVPWGASPEKGRQIMADNGYSFHKDFTDPEKGTPILSFKGPYGSLPAYIGLNFMNRQMWQLYAVLYEDEVGLEWAFTNLNRQLTEKYGPKSRDASYNMEIWKQPKSVPITKYVWSMDGGAKTITLIKHPSHNLGDKDKFLGRVSVTYENIQLYEALKKNNI